MQAKTWETGTAAVRSRRVVRPACRPAKERGTTLEPCRASSHRTGRAKVVLPLACHRMLLEKLREASRPGSAICNTCIVLGTSSPAQSAVMHVKVVKD